jgi:hypothetical protein
MGDVVFISTRPERGTVRATGAVTGMVYGITAYGTPIASVDAPGILKMVGDPCCGHTLPFGGKVKLFGIAVPTSTQMANVPDEILNWRMREMVAEEMSVPKDETPMVAIVESNFESSKKKRKIEEVL